MQTKLIDIGNSKGLRIPKNLINKYHLQAKLNLEEKADGILIRADIPVHKLSWEETYRDMGNSKEDWGDWDLTAADGINLL